jgi:hypothetical protein
VLGERQVANLSNILKPVLFVVALCCCFAWFPPCSIARHAEGAVANSVFDLETADGALHTGPLVELHEDGSLALGGPQPIRVSGKEVIVLRRVGSRAPAWPSCEHVLLTSGDVLAGSPIKMSGDQLILRARLSSQGAERTQELHLNMPSVSLIWLAGPADGGQREAMERRLMEERRRRDTLWLRNGDRIEGLFAAIDDKLVDFKTERGKRSQMERDRVAAIALSTELALKPRSETTSTRLVLANGSRVSLTGLRLDKSDLVGRMLSGAELRVPLAEYVTLEPRGSRSVYLSDLRPARFEETPYFSTRWGYRKDASIVGRGLQLEGNHFDKGIGMHSAGRLTYELGGRYQRFETWVGLDENTGREGNVTVQVLVDGKAQNLGWNGELDGHDPAKHISLSVARARELTLVVGFGRRGDIQDHVNWAEARLIRSRPN